jgi:hypothetical protein
MKSSFTLSTIALLLSTACSQAALSLNFNTVTEVFSFGGTQAAVTDTYNWGATGTTISITPSPSSAIDGATGDVLAFFNDNMLLALSGLNFVGNGTTVSYALASVAAKNHVLTLNGGTLTSLSGLSDINVTVVPEPSQYAALGGVALLGFAFLRRHLSRQFEIA